MSEKLYTVGKIANTHGLRGELKIVSQTDFPEIRFKKGSKLAFQHPETLATVPVVVENARLHKNMYMVKFVEFNDINDAEKYKGWLLKVSESEQVELEEGEYYYHEIMGCKVITDEGEELGIIDEILRPGANDVWVVKRPKGSQVLLPVIDDVVLDVNVKDKIVKVHLMEGLL